jgi:hypothetical protein
MNCLERGGNREQKTSECEWGGKGSEVRKRKRKNKNGQDKTFFFLYSVSGVYFEADSTRRIEIRQIKKGDKLRRETN